ncbi:molybdopterin oxidoreductase family protein [Candidatus Latescibacterota bacterium]
MLNKQENICLLCSLGCGFIIESVFGEAVNLEYMSNDSTFGGSLCSKGNYMIELLNHPSRLIEPSAGGEALTWKDALSRTAEALGKEKGSAGIIISGDASLEDTASAGLFAAQCIGNGSFAVHFATGDDNVIGALAESGSSAMASIEDIGTSQCTIAVGDPFEVGPVISGKVISAKHARRGNMLAVVSDSPNRTSRFASSHLSGNVRKNLAELLRAVVDISGDGDASWKDIVRKKYPVSQNAVVKDLAERFMKAESAVLMLETQDTVAAELASLIVEAAGDSKKLYPLNTYGNAEGICAVLEASGNKKQSAEDIISAALKGKLKSLIVLGADILKGMPEKDAEALRDKVDFIIAGAPFENETTKAADIVLPTALWLETEGTYIGTGRSPVVNPPGGAISYGEIFRKLAAEMNQILPPGPIKTEMMRKAPSDERVSALLKDIENEAPEPVNRSTTLSYADGSLTDNMGWIKLQKRDAW